MSIQTSNYALKVKQSQLKSKIETINSSENVFDRTLREKSSRPETPEFQTSEGVVMAVLPYDIGSSNKNKSDNYTIDTDTSIENAKQIIYLSCGNPLKNNTKSKTIGKPSDQLLTASDDDPKFKLFLTRLAMGSGGGRIIFDASKPGFVIPTRGDKIIIQTVSGDEAYPGRIIQVIQSAGSQYTAKGGAKKPQTTNTNKDTAAQEPTDKSADDKVQANQEAGEDYNLTAHELSQKYGGLSGYIEFLYKKFVEKKSIISSWNLDKSKSVVQSELSNNASKYSKLSKCLVNAVLITESAGKPVGVSGQKLNKSISLDKAKSGHSTAYGIGQVTLSTFHPENNKVSNAASQILKVPHYNLYDPENGIKSAMIVLQKKIQQRGLFKGVKSYVGGDKIYLYDKATKIVEECKKEPTFDVSEFINWLSSQEGKAAAAAKKASAGSSQV